MNFETIKGTYFYFIFYRFLCYIILVLYTRVMIFYNPTAIISVPTFYYYKCYHARFYISVAIGITFSHIQRKIE